MARIGWRDEIINGARIQRVLADPERCQAVSKAREFYMATLSQKTLAF
jgi:hypothetical protein